MAAIAWGCTDRDEAEGASDDGANAEPTTPGDGHKVEADPERVDTRPPPMAQPVPLWKDGETTKKVDAATASLKGYVVLDLGEEWTPYIFTEHGTPDEEPIAHPYRDTYLALARGEFPDDHHGRRAQSDKYLEPYGIMPTLSVLRERFRNVKGRECRKEIDLEPLQEFEGFIAYRGNQKARWNVRHYGYVKTKVEEAMRQQGVGAVAQLNPADLKTQTQRLLRDYKNLHPETRAIRAAQKRLECMGFFEGKGKYVSGGLDWATHQALAEFERRQRVYGWGYIGKETLEKLRHTPMELERQSLVRVLTERAMHAAGVLEDGSTATLHDDKPRTYTGTDGKEHPIRDLEQELSEAITKAFGLETPEAALKWLESLGKLPPEQERLVAFPGPALPEYYDGDMDLFVQIDRGDVWYEFPFDDEGNQRKQPVSRRPKVTLFVKYLDQNIPLARFGTTIGGWRSESVNGTVMWKYKNSPVGPRVWHQIISAPVWLPPESTPSGDLLKRVPGETGRDRYEVNYHETGPSYASAYGLVAAYHRKFRRLPDGGLDIGGDEGIRTHGSVDYMSIMRRHSHGCHRLHNHLAVRLMSFVLAHRPHERVGEQSVSYTLPLERDDYEYQLNLTQGGYVFALERPIHVNVLEGRIRGRVEKPIRNAIPKYTPDAGYIHPDGGRTVTVNRYGKMETVELPEEEPDAGVSGGGSDLIDELLRGSASSVLGGDSSASADEGEEAEALVPQATN